mgnify:CR=1 FL=1
MPFIIIFIVIPFIELMIFASVSEHIGIFTALLLAFITAIIGGTLVKRQGIQTILAMREAMNIGKIPLSELFDGFCLVAAGAFLITPGFLTDTIGFLLLVPQIRNTLRHLIKEHTNWLVYKEGASQKPRETNVIEGEYEEID